MINYKLLHDRGILALMPEGPLEVADFTVITSQVDAYLAGLGKLHGVFIRAKSFPGWKDFAAMVAHLKFVKDLCCRGWSRCSRVNSNPMPRSGSWLD